MSRDGLVVVDKPGGMTSHDVVARVRRLAGTRRVGHGGTLDPMATGVLVVGIGRATRLLSYVVGVDKSYLATIRLGQSTVTDDADGELVASAGTEHLTEAAVRAAVRGFVGTIDQVPSAVSAIKVDGVRSYRRVRAGAGVDLPARRVTISRLEVLGIGAAGPVLDVAIDVTCSTGTYVRAIARDLGAVLGVGGHLTALRRTAVGGFTVAESVTLAQLAERADPVMMSLSEAAIRLFPRRDVRAAQARVLAHGGRIDPAGLAGPYAVFDPEGDVVAVVRDGQGRARPEVVLYPASGSPAQRGSGTPTRWPSGNPADGG